MSKETPKASLTAQPRGSQQSKTPAVSVLVKLWLSMTGLYQHKWVSACGDLPVSGNGTLTLAGAIWANGLAGLSASRIEEAIAEVANGSDEWPPSLPRFRAMCLGVPTFAKASHDFAKRTLTPFTAQMWLYLDGYRFTRSDQRAANLMLVDAYELAKAHVMAGGELPAPVAEVEHKPEPRKPSTPEIAAKHCAELSALLGEPIADAA